MTQTYFSRTKQWILPALALCLITVQSTAQTFTGEGKWKNAGNWNPGIPADGATAIINGTCEISENIGPANTFNPARLVVGEGTEGVLNVTGGTLSGAHGGGSTAVFTLEAVLEVWVKCSLPTGRQCVRKGAACESR